jgi:hypothetical protein
MEIIFIQFSLTFSLFSFKNIKKISLKKFSQKEAKFTSDIFLPYLSPQSCPYACCNPLLRHRNNNQASYYYQRPRYSMPVAPVNYQIVPIRHTSSFNNREVSSTRNLNSFTRSMIFNDREHSQSRVGTLIRSTDERRSPYYYNDLITSNNNNNNNNSLHAINSQFLPINEGNLNDDNFTDFINTIHHPEIDS